jgi:hypothetical protein
MSVKRSAAFVRHSADDLEARIVQDMADAGRLNSPRALAIAPDKNFGRGTAPRASADQARQPRATVAGATVLSRSSHAIATTAPSEQI